MSILELRRVSKVYGQGAAEVHALDRVTLSVDEGAMVAVMGPSGSGKSTLLTIARAVRRGSADRPDVPGTAGTLTGAQLEAMAAESRGIAASLGSRDIVQLETTDSVLQRAASRRNWYGPVYVATPRLLRAYGISPAQVSSDTDVLTMRPGLSSLTKMQFLYGSPKFGPPGGSSPCPPSYCLENPKIQEVSALPAGTSAPNTVITEHAVRQFHLTTSTAGWLIQTADALTAGQISAAQHAAAADGLTVERRNSIPTSAEILDVATVFGILLALGILAMTVGLLRSEMAGEFRTLTATGASGTTRRGISAATAGVLALIGAVVGTAAGYIAAIGFFRTNQLDTLSSLTSIPVANLLLILVGMPLVAVIGGSLLAGREPSAIGRRRCPGHSMDERSLSRYGRHMPLDSGLLGQARAAEARVIDAEQDAEAARAEFGRAIRRLQLAGASLREIAEEFGLSHQRIHQIVAATGRSRSWRGGRAGAGELLSCSFCGKQQKQVKKLIAGPDARICDGCAGRVHTVLAAPGATASTPIAAIEQVSDESRESCSFCGKRRYQVEAMAAARYARICNECLDLCDEIVSDELP
jgi:energy-coupling factor transporter ATP-binding protein EcfA2